MSTHLYTRFENPKYCFKGTTKDILLTKYSTMIRLSSLQIGEVRNKLVRIYEEDMMQLYSKQKRQLPSYESMKSIRTLVMTSV